MANFQILRAKFIRFSIFTLLCWFTRPQHMLTLSVILIDTNIKRVLGCLAICYRKNESVLSVRRVMQHLVTHTDSYGCLYPCQVMVVVPR